MQPNPKMVLGFLVLVLQLLFVRKRHA